MRVVQDLLAEALQLDDEQRADLALSLMDSLSPPDQRDEPAWIEEIERRARRALSGEDAGIEVDEAIDGIARDLGL